MTIIQAEGLDCRSVNNKLRQADGACTITGCRGQRFLASGMSDRRITIEGVPGNALGAYLNGASITVKGNAQDAIGDTMNAGTIVIHGSAGDAAGYAMRGGRIFVKGSAGYRAGIHMKEYEEKTPVLVIGGTAGSFLGEYQAGGVIIVLGLGAGKRSAVGSFPCTGMHGGKLFLRGGCGDIRFPSQVTVKTAGPEDMRTVGGHIAAYCGLFGFDMAEVLGAPFTIVTPDSKNPYRQMYVAN